MTAPPGRQIVPVMEPAPDKTDFRGQSSVIRRVTVAGLITNILLSAAKLSGGILASSQAVAADGVHSLSDCVTDIVILLGVRYWSQPPDESHPYGHQRIETIITAFIGLALAGTAVGLGWHAVTSITDPATEGPGVAALVASLLSVVVKEILFRWTRRAGDRVGSSALVANAWHHRSDAISSVPVVAAVIAARIDPTLAFLDGVGALVVSAFILFAAWRIVAPAMGQLADRSAPPADVAKIANIVAQVDGVTDVHRLRTRFGGSWLQVDMHITVEGSLSVTEGHDIATKVQRRVMSEGPGVVDVVVHVEPNVQIRTKNKSI